MINQWLCIFFNMRVTISSIRSFILAFNIKTNLAHNLTYDKISSKINKNKKSECVLVSNASESNFLATYFCFDPFSFPIYLYHVNNQKIR